jgi:hypothetical protein
MSTELILSIVSLGLSTITSILTLIINAKIGRLNNLEAEHKYKKHITKFELSFKDAEWLFNLMKSDEFHNYDNKSRRLIHKWWREYSNTYLPEKLKATLPNSHDFSGVILRCPLPVEVPVEDGADTNKED